MYPQAADKYLSNIVLSPFGEGTLKPPPIKTIKSNSNTLRQTISDTCCCILEAFVPAYTNLLTQTNKRAFHFPLKKLLK